MGKRACPAPFAQERSNPTPATYPWHRISLQGRKKPSETWQGVAALLQPRGCLKGCPPGWAGHPFRGSEHAISKVCLFSSSTTLWTPWWVSLARNPSLKGRCLVGGGLGKSKRRTGGLRWISQVVYVKWLESNLPASHQAASDVKSSAQEGFLPQS